MSEAADRLVDGAREAERQVAPWIQRFARGGYAAKGVVYGLMAVLGLRAAWSAEKATGSRGALATLVGEPLGRVILGIIALGLFGYALWGLYQGLRNPEADSAGARISHAVTGVIHLGLAATAARLTYAGQRARAQIGGGNDETDQQVTELTADAMQRPLGSWLVIGAGAAFSAHALWQFYRAATAKLDDQLDLNALTSARRTWLVRVSRLGIAARGVVFLVIGGFVLRAGLEYDPSQVRDVGGALRMIEQQPYGRWLLAFVATGLLGYAAYQFIRARYRLIEPGSPVPRTRIRLKRV
jgi:hypothetical protein